jgi:hypothetical protein
MVLPMFAALLPGLASAGKRFVSGVAADVMSGKGLGESLKKNAIETAEGVIPGAGSIIQKAVYGAQRLIQGRKIKQLEAPKNTAIAQAPSMEQTIAKLQSRVKRYKKLSKKGRGEPGGVPA